MHRDLVSNPCFDARTNDWETTNERYADPSRHHGAGRVRSGG